jgi:hypothetical protein
MPYTETPTWRLRESLRRSAEETIKGRASFEQHFNRVSDKPLKRIELDPHEVLQLLDALDTATAEVERLTSEKDAPQVRHDAEPSRP